MSIIAATDKDGRRSGPVLLPIAAKPGPISPGHCKLLPPGIGRATAGIPFSVTLQSFDANERKIYEGGARVKLKAVRELLPQVEKNAAAGAATATATATAGGGGDIIEGTVRDHRDGSYGLTLSVPDGGKYKVAVQVNSVPIKDSPFSLSAISFTTKPAGLGTAAPAAPTGPTATQQQGGGNGNRNSNSSAPGASASASPQQKQAGVHRAGSGPKLDSSDLSKVLNVGNISPQVDIDQLRTFFVFFGSVLDCSYAGSKQFALVRYTSTEEAERAAKALNGMKVGDRPLRVEVAAQEWKPPAPLLVPVLVPAPAPAPAPPLNMARRPAAPAALNRAMEVAAEYREGWEATGTEAQIEETGAEE
eukprot:CAMPEP_0182605804 /NCGR_PEP_ID=MMETSP1330-20130603/732_1 /TAXON_ID=464278 /ORGANISM="Picochlorum sp., Strain RCC944" /LENGTH=361 /DNA_ID=CAMNT_0024823897 /DNA_START=68 /DNA_END=1151 /DNA_ORIENTATION=-